MARRATLLSMGRLRRQALDWLRADLADGEKRLADGGVEARSLAALTMNHLQTAAELAGVRDPAALGKLAAEERAKWEQLWSEVAQLASRLGQRP